MAIKFGFQNLRLLIKSSHSRIRDLRDKMKEIKQGLESSVSTKYLHDTEDYKEKRMSDQLKSSNDCHIKKLKKLNPKDKKVDLEENSNWVMNLSNCSLTPMQNQVLAMGLNYSVVPKDVPKRQIIASAEKTIRKLPAHRASLVRSKLIQTIGSYGRVTPNLSTEEKIAIKELRSNKDIVILKADKGNSTVIMNSEDYNAKISQLLDDDTTYK